MAANQPMSPYPPIERFGQANTKINGIFNELLTLLVEEDEFVKGMLNTNFSNADTL